MLVIGSSLEPRPQFEDNGLTAKYDPFSFGIGSGAIKSRSSEKGSGSANLTTKTGLGYNSGRSFGQARSKAKYRFAKGGK